MKPPLIVIAGPTASGKTALSVQLAKHIQGEIISCDSMQVYRGMTIGTAKVLPEEMDGVPHHMIDVLNPDDGCSIARFQAMVKEAMADIYSRGKVPILAGGTGFYIQAIVNDIDFEAHKGDEAYRRELEEQAKAEEGRQSLHRALEAIDPQSAEAIHPNNTKRVIRALEYHHQTGEKMSDHNTKEREKTSPYNVGFYVLTMDRDVLYDRINRRVDKMMAEGLVAEVRTLLEAGYDEGLTSMEGLGYKEILRYIKGEWSKEMAVETLKRDTRHFAKRQLTWFRREPLTSWVNLSEMKGDTAAALNFILKDIEEKKILYYNESTYKLRSNKF